MKATSILKIFIALSILSYNAATAQQSQKLRVMVLSDIEADPTTLSRSFAF
jgi:hypothetical protein